MCFPLSILLVLRIVYIWSVLNCFFARAVRFTAGSIVSLRLSNNGSALSASNGNAIFLDEISPSGTLLQTLPAPTSCTLDAAVRGGSYYYEGRICPSVDRQLVAFSCFGAAIGVSVTSATRQITSVGIDGTFSSPVSTALTGVGAFSAIKVYNTASGGFYHGAWAGLYYIPPAGGSYVQLQSTLDVATVGIFANSLCE